MNDLLTKILQFYLIFLCWVWYCLKKNIFLSSKRLVNKYFLNRDLKHNTTTLFRCIDCMRAQHIGDYNLRVKEHTYV